jgi:hypothetical protein
MPQRPELPLEAQAAIERAREHILMHARVTWRLLFPPTGITAALQDSLVSKQRKPASLKLELREYSSALFDAEAQHCMRCSGSEPELRSSLEALARCIMAEVMDEFHSQNYDFHCPHEDRKRAIGDGLKERIEHWMKTAAADPKVSAAWEWGRRGKPISLATMQAGAPPTALTVAQAEHPKTETLAKQIRALRQECRMTIEELASAVHLAARNVRRHEAGQSQIRARNLHEYERVFSGKLKRQVRLKSS